MVGFFVWKDTTSKPTPVFVLDVMFLNVHIGIVAMAIEGQLFDEPHCAVFLEEYLGDSASSEFRQVNVLYTLILSKT